MPLHNNNRACKLCVTGTFSSPCLAFRHSKKSPILIITQQATKTQKMFFFPQSSVLAQRDLATALNTSPAVCQLAWWNSWRALRDTGLQFDCWPTLTQHNPAYRLWPSALLRLASSGSSWYTKARRKEGETHNASVLSWVFQLFRWLPQHLCSLIFQMLMPRKSAFLCVIALRGIRTILDTEKLFYYTLAFRVDSVFSKFVYPLKR